MGVYTDARAWEELRGEVACTHATAPLANRLLGALNTTELFVRMPGVPCSACTSQRRPGWPRQDCSWASVHKPRHAAPPVAVMRKIELAHDAHDTQHNLHRGLQREGAAAEAKVRVRTVRLPPLRTMDVDGTDVHEPPGRPGDEEGAGQHVAAEAAVLVAAVGSGVGVCHVPTVLHRHSVPQRSHAHEKQDTAIWSITRRVWEARRTVSSGGELSRQGAMLASAPQHAPACIHAHARHHTDSLWPVAPRSALGWECGPAAACALARDGLKFSRPLVCHICHRPGIHQPEQRRPPMQHMRSSSTCTAARIRRRLESFRESEIRVHSRALP